jgi:hypothetical protein
MNTLSSPSPSPSPSSSEIKPSLFLAYNIQKALNNFRQAIECPINTLVNENDQDQNNNDSSEASYSTRKRKHSELELTTPSQDRSTSNNKHRRRDQQPSNDEKFEPWNRTSFADRVKSFKTWTWFGKSSLEISPLQCARHGWYNTDQDTLTCKMCHATLIWSVPSTLPPLPNATLITLHHQASMYLLKKDISSLILFL